MSTGKRRGRLQLASPAAPPSKNPVRDTFLVYGALALIVVLFSWLTGGSIGRGVVVAGLFFVAATTWSLYRRLMRARAAARRGDVDE